MAEYELAILKTHTEAKRSKLEVKHEKTRHVHDKEQHETCMKRAHHEMDLESLMCRARVDRVKSRTHSNDNLADIARLAAALQGKGGGGGDSQRWRWN